MAWGNLESPGSQVRLKGAGRSQKKKWKKKMMEKMAKQKSKRMMKKKMWKKGSWPDQFACRAILTIHKERKRAIFKGKGKVFNQSRI